MLGFTAFGVATFGQSTSGAPVVVLASVGAITTTLAGTAALANALVSVSTVGLINSATGTIGGVVGNASITMTGVNATFTLISSLTPFTWTNISDTVGESWGAISTTGSSESWTEVEDDSTNEATTWTDA